MSSISSWVISIAGICLLSIVVDLILPDGKMNKSVKNAFSYLIILIVILPLPNLINSDFSFDYAFSNNELEIQNNYIYNFNQSKLDEWTKIIDNDLKEKQIFGAVVSISANIFEIDMKVDAVYVDLYNVVINENLQNNDIKTEVISVVENVLKIDKNKVIFYE